MIMKKVNPGETYEERMPICEEILTQETQYERSLFSTWKI